MLQSVTTHRIHPVWLWERRSRSSMTNAMSCMPIRGMQFEVVKRVRGSSMRDLQESQLKLLLDQTASLWAEVVSKEPDSVSGETRFHITRVPTASAVPASGLPPNPASDGFVNFGPPGNRETACWTLIRYISMKPDPNHRRYTWETSLELVRSPGDAISLNQQDSATSKSLHRTETFKRQCCILCARPRLRCIQAPLRSKPLRRLENQHNFKRKMRAWSIN